MLTAHALPSAEPDPLCLMWPDAEVHSCRARMCVVNEAARGAIKTIYAASSAEGSHHAPLTVIHVAAVSAIVCSAWSATQVSPRRRRHRPGQAVRRPCAHAKTIV